MQTTPNPTPDDPHDTLGITPDVVLVARAEEELSRLARHTLKRPSDLQPDIGPAPSVAPSVPQIDTTFRAAAVDNVPVAGDRPLIGRWAIRGLIGCLLALCVGVVASAWPTYGDAARQMLARWVPQPAAVSLRSSDDAPAVETSAATVATPRPMPLDYIAPEAVTPSADAAPLLQSLARDLAAMRQQVEQLKASVEQLKASQEQMSRDVAKVTDTKASEAKASEIKASDQNLRPKMLAPPARTAVAPVRRPVSPSRPAQAAADPMPPPPAALYVPPPAAGPSVPRQVEPPRQAMTAPQVDPDVPRPPMPVR
jgi:hypothetical protein